MWTFNIRPRDFVFRPRSWFTEWDQSNYEQSEQFDDIPYEVPTELKGHQEYLTFNYDDQVKIFSTHPN